MSLSLQDLDGQVTTPQEKISHDEVYFVKDFVVIQIENRLFKFPRRHLVKQSFIFAKWSGDEMNPFIINDVTVQDFRYFLEILLPDSTTDPVDLWLCNHVRRPSEDVWISVLKLSTKWFCLNIRLLAIQNLNSISAEKKWPQVRSIMRGCKYHIRHWVISGYKALSKRSVGISDEEATEVGLLESLRIMRIRESPSLVGGSVDVEIRKVFKDELASIDAMNESFISSTDIRIRIVKSGAGNQNTPTVPQASSPIGPPIKNP